MATEPMTLVEAVALAIQGFKGDYTGGVVGSKEVMGDE